MAFAREVLPCHSSLLSRRGVAMDNTPAFGRQCGRTVRAAPRIAPHGDLLPTGRASEGPSRTAARGLLRDRAAVVWAALADVGAIGGFVSLGSEPGQPRAMMMPRLAASRGRMLFLAESLFVVGVVVLVVSLGAMFAAVF